MRLTVHHTTRYSFDAPVRYGLQQVRKTPKTNDAQWVLNWSTEISGGTRELTYEDHHNNVVELISLERDATELVIVSSGDVEISESHGVIGRHRGPAPLWLYQRVTPRTKAGTEVRGLVRKLKSEEPLQSLHSLMAEVSGAVSYELGVSEPSWSAEDALEAGRGVCQDHAHVFIACCREMAIPARYVSGYLMMGDRIEQEAMHAWAEAHVPGLGWVGFDVTNCISPDERYVRVATGLDYSDAAPVTGRREGGDAETLDVRIEVAQQ